jgi:hypothetical protein
LTGNDDQTVGFFVKIFFSILTKTAFSRGRFNGNHGVAIVDHRSGCGCHPLAQIQGGVNQINFESPKILHKQQHKGQHENDHFKELQENAHIQNPKWVIYTRTLGFLKYYTFRKAMINCHP